MGVGGGVDGTMPCYFMASSGSWLRGINIGLMAS